MDKQERESTVFRRFRATCLSLLVPEDASYVPFTVKTRVRIPLGTPISENHGKFGGYAPVLGRLFSLVRGVNSALEHIPDRARHGFALLPPFASPPEHSGKREDAVDDREEDDGDDVEFDVHARGSFSAHY